MRFRVAALLALSLLPIGLVTILQTRELSEEVESRAELTLLSLTNRATFGERQATERAFGAAEALTVVLELLRDEPEACRDYLSRYVERAEGFSFIGFIQADGIMRCASGGRSEIDYSDDPTLTRLREEPRSYVARIDTPDISPEPVINITRPVEADARLVGFVSVSIPLRYALERPDMPREVRPLSLVTFNDAGSMLAVQIHPDSDGLILPGGVELAALVGTGPRTFDAKDTEGADRTFAIVPIIPDRVYALAAWPAEKRGATLAGMAIPPTLMPLLMFAASIAVAYLAVDRLVVRHVTELRGMMNAFARRRSLPSRRNRSALSTELRELEEGFVDMAMDLSNDEARMEDALREKNILLKEIHHRVKNNLQLISSIMNMQIRAARQDETVSVLRRLQERVLGLATVHRNLYQTDDLSRTNAGRLLDDLFRQLATMIRDDDRPDVDYSGEFDDIILYPDQALPLSLLASELGTNALKNVHRNGEGRKYVRASLRKVSSDEAELTCENTVDPGAIIDERPGGLGARLIRAFAAQLGGQVRTETRDGRHRVSLRFRVESFSQAPADY